MRRKRTFLTQFFSSELSLQLPLLLLLFLPFSCCYSVSLSMGECQEARLFDRNTKDILHNNNTVQVSKGKSTLYACVTLLGLLLRFLHTVRCSTLNVDGKYTSTLKEWHWQTDDNVMMTMMSMQWRCVWYNVPVWKNMSGKQNNNRWKSSLEKEWNMYLGNVRNDKTRASYKWRWCTYVAGSFQKRYSSLFLSLTIFLFPFLPLVSCTYL